MLFRLPELDYSYRTKMISSKNPARAAELFDTEVNYLAIIRKIDKLGYDGCFGLEYFPGLDHTESLKRTLEYLS